VVVFGSALQAARACWCFVRRCFAVLRYLRRCGAAWACMAFATGERLTLLRRAGALLCMDAQSGLRCVCISEAVVSLKEAVLTLFLDFSH
ncbi:hypothetical protein NPIL_410581, partial [Nephila pilipes]